jgi:periplasmic protein TonB
MKESYLFDMSFNNVVFKGRNLAYGAYKLRKSYNRHITLAAIIGTSIFAGAFAIPVIKNMMYGTRKAITEQEEPVFPEKETTMPLLPPPKEKLPKAEQPIAQPKKEKIAMEKYVQLKVVDNATETVEDVPDQSKLNNVLIGSKTQEGILPDPPTVMINETAPEGLSSGSTAPSEPFIVVEQMPLFGESEKDLMVYINKNIRYPLRARNAGIEGLIILTFVVSAQGEVKDVQILKGLGYGTEEEAIRVVQGMPKWKPGKQNNIAVPVRYTLPIRLQIQN